VRCLQEPRIGYKVFEARGSSFVKMFLRWRMVVLGRFIAEVAGEASKEIRSPRFTSAYRVNSANKVKQMLHVAPAFVKK